jgi:hypothetical protein
MWQAALESWYWQMAHRNNYFWIKNGNSLMRFDSMRQSFNFYAELLSSNKYIHAFENTESLKSDRHRINVKGYFRN